MEIYKRVEIQKLKTNNTDSLLDKYIQVNSNSAIDNYIIAKVSARDRFILRPQEYELFISSAVSDIEKELDKLMKVYE